MVFDADLASRKAVTFGLEGTTLSDKEASLFRDAKPFGYILFGRNLETPDQVRALTDAIRAVDGRDDPPILIDQEGGRVQRLRRPSFIGSLAAEKIGKLYAHDPQAGERAAYLHMFRIGLELRSLGISVNCAPCLDLRVSGASSAIGDRAYSTDATSVAKLGAQAIRGLREAGVTPFIKHLPGHGRATIDSHAEAPVINAPLPTLKETDFQPFIQNVLNIWGMTGHLILSEVDPTSPVTHSARAINTLIRREIGFSGPLFSDDLSMGALRGTVTERALSALEAGCDIGLHCNGNFFEMQALAGEVPTLSDITVARFKKTPPVASVAHPSHTLEAVSTELADLVGEPG